MVGSTGQGYGQEVLPPVTPCSGAVYVSEGIAEQTAAECRSRGIGKFTYQCGLGHWHIGAPKKGVSR